MTLFSSRTPPPHTSPSSQTPHPAAVRPPESAKV